MYFPFSLLIGLLTFFFVVVTGLASLPQLFNRASSTTASIISLFARDSLEIVVARIEHNINGSTDAVTHIRAATLRVGNPFTQPVGDRAVMKRQLIHELLSQGFRMPYFSGITARWASDSSVMAVAVGTTVKTQLCQTQDRFLGPPFSTRTLDRLANCSISVLLYPEGTLMDPSNPTVTEPWPSNFRTAYLGGVWNLTLNTMRRLRRVDRATRGFWLPAPFFYYIIGPAERSGLTELSYGFTYQYTSMNFDPVTDEPVAMVNGRTMFTEFGTTLQKLLPTKNSRAFLVDGLDNVMSYSHGASFRLFNRSVPVESRLVGQKNCYIFNAEPEMFGCFYNISSHPEFEMLKLVADNKTSPIAAVVSVSADDEDDLTNINHKLMKVPRMVTLANGSRYVAFTKPLRNSFVGFTFQAYIFVPVDYFEQGVVAARISTIAVVAAVGVFGALLSVAVVWWTTRSVAELAERMSEDPFGTKVGSGAAARRRFLQQKRQMLAEIFGESPPSSTQQSADCSANSHSLRVNAVDSSPSSNRELATMSGTEDDDDVDADASGDTNHNRPPRISRQHDDHEEHQQEPTAAADSAPQQQQSETEGGPPSLLQRIGLFFSQFEEVTTLEAEFDAFRAVIDELRGFIRLPVTVQSATLDTVAEASTTEVIGGTTEDASGDASGAVPSSSTADNSNNNNDEVQRGDDAQGETKRKKRVIISDAVEIVDDDEAAAAAGATSGGAATRRCSSQRSMRANRPVLLLSGDVCKSTMLFVAVIHVAAFNGAERDAIFSSPTTRSSPPTDSKMRACDEKFLQFAILVVESLNFLAVSNGATITEFHGDHFLICVQSRASAMTKMPTRFAMRLAHFARLFAVWLAREEAARVSSNNNNIVSAARRFELSAGLSMSSAKMFVDSASSRAQQQPEQRQQHEQHRSLSFFGPCFGEAFAIEHALRTYAPAITPAELQQQQRQRQATSTASGVPEQRAGNNLQMKTVRRNTGAYADGTELTHAADAFKHRLIVSGGGGDDDDEAVVRESDANTMRNALAGVFDVVRQQKERRQEESSPTVAGAAPASRSSDSSNRPIPHCIGFPTRLQGMFESVRCVRFLAPSFRKNMATVDKDETQPSPFRSVAMKQRYYTEKHADWLASLELDRDLYDMMRLVQVTRVAKATIGLPIAPL